MIRTDMRADFDWQEWRSEPGDLVKIGLPAVKRMLFDIFLINEFELSVLKLKKDNCVWGPVHSSIGQEAVAAASIAPLRKEDQIVGSHRAHHQFLAKLLGAIDWDPLKDAPDAVKEAVRRTLAEIMGLAPGYCGGRGGSMHLHCSEAGVLGTNAIVGGGTSLAAGSAFAQKQSGSGNVTVCFLGDGAVNQGIFHEACNLAGLWNLPIIYFIENNLYAVATHSDDACAVKDLAARAATYNMSAITVNGMDTAAIYSAVEHSVSNIRGGGRPCIIEAKCYRHYHHAGDMPGSAFGYRKKEEEAEWMSIDALTSFPKEAVDAKLLTKSEVERLRETARSLVEQAEDFCTLCGEPRTVRAELYPSADTLCEGVRSGGGEWKGVKFRERRDFDKFTDMKFTDAVSAVQGRWLERDEKVVVLGEEVANFGAGAYGATKNLARKYPKRVLNTPISEAGFVGLSGGAAMMGMRPVVEIMYPDFSLLAGDQLFSQIAKLRHMYGGTLDVPLVARTRVGIGTGYGGQHSMDPVALFALFPGWRIVYPSSAFDYIGLFNSAILSLDPTLVVEHQSFYAQKFPVPESDMDYFIRFGKAAVAATGSDVTLVTYGPMVGRCASIASQLGEKGISVEVIDLRSVDLLSIDYETIGASVAKTGAAAVVEEAPRSQSIGAALAAEITERFFDYLDCTVVRLASKDVPNPVSRVLEAAAIIGDGEIISAVTELAGLRSF